MLIFSGQDKEEDPENKELEGEMSKMLGYEKKVWSDV